MESAHELAGVALIIGLSFIGVMLLSIGSASLKSWWRWRQFRKQGRI